MKKYSLLMLITMSVSLSWSQAWNKTFEINSMNVEQLPVSNSMVQVGNTPNQIWTVVNDHSGANCGDRLWLHAVDDAGTVLNSTSISKASEVNLEAYAIEEFFGDLFIGGSSKNCVDGTESAFLMALSNSGSFVSAVDIVLNDHIEITDIVKLPSSQFMAIGFTGKQNQGSMDPFSVVFDQALNVLSAQVYQIPGDNVPTQAVLNSSGTVSVVGFDMGPSGKLIFTMDLNVTGAINGPYMTYSNGASEMDFPSICVFRNDLLVSSSIDMIPGQTDILLLELDGTNRTVNNAWHYDNTYSDHPVQVFERGGNFAIAYGSQDYSGIAHNGLLYINSNGAVDFAERLSNYNGGLTFAAVQSAGLSDEFFMAAARGYGYGALEILRDGYSINSPCRSLATFTMNTTVFTTTSTTYQSSSFTTQSTSFFTNTMTGYEFSCAGTGTGTFKKDGPTSIAENGANEMGLEVYPTASSDQIHFEMEEAIDGVAKIYSMQGKLLYSEIFKDGNGNLSIAGFTQGQYILEVNSNKGAARRVISKI